RPASVRCGISAGAAAEGLAEDVPDGDRWTAVPAGLAPGGGGLGAVSRPLDPPCLGDRGGPDRRRADGLAAGGMGLCGEQAMRYTREELAEARRSIDSTLRKCEKALEKLRPGTSPHT
ncbi:Asp23/Gls24 family envelope stress response protein, partial [Dysosmobacter welbionis]